MECGQGGNRRWEKGRGPPGPLSGLAGNRLASQPAEAIRGRRVTPLHGSVNRYVSPGGAWCSGSWVAATDQGPRFVTQKPCRRLAVAVLRVDCLKRLRTAVAHGRRLEAAGTGSWVATTDQSPRIGTMNQRLKTQRLGADKEGLWNLCPPQIFGSLSGGSWREPTARQRPRFRPMNPLRETAALKPPQSRRFAPHGISLGRASVWTAVASAPLLSLPSPQTRCEVHG